MQKKILAILGSPHVNGINAQMLNIAIKQSEKNGDEVRIINLYKKRIAFCKGCLYCQKTSSCAIQDDIQEIAQDIKWCDTIILASPIYWANVPSIVKNMMDRLFGTTMQETKFFPKPLLKGKKYILLTSCNTPLFFAKIAGQLGGIKKATKEFFSYSGIKKKGIILVSNANKTKSISKSTKNKIKRLVTNC